MKTIKEIADELGMSKTAVRKKIANLGLQSSLRKNGNQFVIDEEQEKLIKSAFQENESQTNSQTETETISAIVCILKKELEQKDKQINDLMEQLGKTTEALQRAQESVQAAQLLHGNAEQKVKMLEQKQEEETSKKKHWWSRKG